MATLLNTEHAKCFLASEESSRKAACVIDGNEERGKRGTGKLKPASRDSETKNSRTRRTFRDVVADDISSLELFEPGTTLSQPAADEHNPLALSSKVEKKQRGFDTFRGNSRREISSSHATSLVHGSNFGNSSQRPTRLNRLRERAAVDRPENCRVWVTKSPNSDVVKCGKNSDERDKKRCPELIKRGRQCVRASDCAVLPVTRGDGVTRQSVVTSYSTVTGGAPPTTAKREAAGIKLDSQPELTGVQGLSHSTGRKYFPKTTGSQSVSSLRFKADNVACLWANTDRYYSRGCGFNGSGAVSPNGTVVFLRPGCVSVLIKEVGKDVDLGPQLCARSLVVADHVFSSKSDQEFGRDVDLGRLCKTVQHAVTPLENSVSGTAAWFESSFVIGYEKDVDLGIVSVERAPNLTHTTVPQRPGVVKDTRFESSSNRSMIPVGVSESVAVIPVPSYIERSVESSVHFKDMRRHKSSVTFEPTLAPIRFADTMVVYGKNSTKKRFISRTFYEPRVKPRKFAETDFLLPKDTTQRFASFLDYHIDECRRWFKTCVELKARTFTTVHTIPDSSSAASSRRTCRQDVTVNGTANGPGYDGPGASQVFIPPYKVGGKELGEMRFRVPLSKENVDINMNGPLTNGF